MFYGDVAAAGCRVLTAAAVIKVCVVRFSLSDIFEKNPLPLSKNNLLIVQFSISVVLQFSY